MSEKEIHRLILQIYKYGPVPLKRARMILDYRSYGTSGLIEELLIHGFTLNTQGRIKIRLGS